MDATSGPASGFRPPTSPFAGRSAPSPGVFTVGVRLDGGDTTLPGVANVGVRPTVGGTERRLEVPPARLLGGSLRRYAEVEFFSRLREERRFESVDVLRDQIGQDVKAAREFFAAQMLG